MMTSVKGKKVGVENLDFITITKKKTTITKQTKKQPHTVIPFVRNNHGKHLVCCLWDICV